jgi:serine/threonine-protein kinase
VTEEIIGGHYKLIEKLGSGACGSVFKAKHLILNKIVAIKLLPTERQADDKVVQRFQREAQAASQLDHPNLMRVLEFGVNAGVTPYLVMELVEGISLSEVLSQKGRLSALRATELALQISAALAHAHKKGIVHRDIKPSNIIITTDQDGNEIAKVVDFGIAKQLPKENEKSGTLTATGEIVGTPLYMSPEQWAGKELDGRSDIYSLGCVLYEMVAGKPAVKAASALEAMMSHANELRPDFENVTVLPYLRTIIEKWWPGWVDWT